MCRAGEAAAAGPLGQGSAVLACLLASPAAIHLVSRASGPGCPGEMAKSSVAALGKRRARLRPLSDINPAHAWAGAISTQSPLACRPAANGSAGALANHGVPQQRPGRASGTLLYFWAALAASR